MSPREIEIHIEELVLHGFSPSDALGIGAAVESELARLLVERGLPESLAAGVSREAIDAGAFERALDHTASAVGAQVAQSVYGGVAR